MTYFIYIDVYPDLEKKKEEEEKGEFWWGAKNEREWYSQCICTRAWTIVH